jgi:hypothetical protein
MNLGSLTWDMIEVDAATVSQSIVKASKKARLIALSRIDRSPYPVLEDLLELRETLVFLRNPLGALRKLSESWREACKLLDASARDIYDLSKAVSNLWLEYRFAVSPLIQSAMTVLDGWNDREVKVPDYGESTATIEEDLQSPVQSIPLYLGYDNLFTFGVNAFATVGVHAGCFWRITDPSNSFSFKYGLRLKDIPEGLWNILPFSFMVDRLVPIATAIRAVTNLSDPGLDIVAGFEVTRLRHVDTCQCTSQTLPGWSITCNGDTVVREKFSYYRSPWEPDILDSLVSYHNPLGLNNTAIKTADLVALIIQNFKLNFSKRTWRFPDFHP